MCCPSQSNLVKQLSKLVKVRYVEDVTRQERVGEMSSHACQYIRPVSYVQDSITDQSLGLKYSNDVLGGALIGCVMC